MAKRAPFAKLAIAVMVLIGVSSVTYAVPLSADPALGINSESALSERQTLSWLDSSDVVLLADDDWDDRWDDDDDDDRWDDDDDDDRWDDDDDDDDWDD